MSGFNGKMYGIKSSHISRVGWLYDEETNQGVMRVEFKSGGIYEYFPVSKQLNNEFWASSNKGKFFTTDIKNGNGIGYEKIS